MSARGSRPWWIAAVAVAAALAGAVHDGLGGVVLWGLAGVGAAHAAGLAWRRGWRAAGRAVPAARAGAADSLGPPPGGTGAAVMDAATLRRFAHDLRNPIAAAATAFEAFDECVGQVAGDDAAFFRQAVRSNLERATVRLAALQQQGGERPSRPAASPPPLPSPPPARGPSSPA